MKRMVNSFKRYLKIFLIFIKMNYLKMLEYRADFFMAFVATAFYSLGYIAFLLAIFNQVSDVSGWDFDKMLTIFSVSQMMFYLSWTFFRYSLSNFHYAIREGNLDSILKLPLKPRFTVTFKDHNTDFPLPFVMALGLFFYSLRNTTLEIQNIFLFLVLLICGFIILYNIFFIFASFSFWIVEGQDLVSLFDEIFSFSRYPKTIFPPAASYFLLTIIPILLMVYVPVTALLNILDWQLGVLAIIMVFVSYYLSEKIWHAGLRHYSSASS